LGLTLKDYSEILVDLKRLVRQYEDAMREGRELTAWTAAQAMSDCVIRLAAISWNFIPKEDPLK
jgi:hypothetical protein